MAFFISNYDTVGHSSSNVFLSTNPPSDPNLGSSGQASGGPAGPASPEPAEAGPASAGPASRDPAERLEIKHEIEQKISQDKELKSLAICAVLRDLGANLTQDQQDILNAHNNPSVAQVMEDMKAFTDRLRELDEMLGDSSDDTDAASVSDNSDKFPGADDENNNNQ